MFSAVTAKSAFVPIEVRAGFTVTVCSVVSSVSIPFAVSSISDILTTSPHVPISSAKEPFERLKVQPFS